MRSGIVGFFGGLFRFLGFLRRRMADAVAGITIGMAGTVTPRVDLLADNIENAAEY